ncbi:MAG: hypothetical protein KatS3mg009_1045 [Acidimicrobiia bacterium]|nr:MAG: hypothetical protein KatS3mg009_1045 [Acidimicrobiia bacterium]
MAARAGTGGTEREDLARARAAYGARDWVAARAAFTGAGADRLDGDDLYALANCSWWLGDLDTALPALQRAHRRYLDEGRNRTAALVALDVGYTFMIRGDEAQATGWLGRAWRQLEDDPDCAEQGYLRYVEAEHAHADGDLDAAERLAHEVIEIGRRHRDPTLVALGVQERGRVLISRGEVQAGLALLDEAMVAAVSDDLDPAWAGNIYCSLMMACWELADWARAAEWTAATAQWCESMPGAGPFAGICRVHRAQLLDARGAWDDAEAEARRVLDELAGFVPAMIGEAAYTLGDLARRRGRLDAAETWFAEAHRLGRDPCPGLALTHLARDSTDLAVAEINRALEAAPPNPLTRARLLAAAVTILVVVGDIDAGADAADELAHVATVFDTTGLHAQAQLAAGSVLLARGDATGALAPLERALRLYQRLRLPYDAAVARLVVARAYEEIGRPDSARRERDAAHEELDGIGACVGAAEPGHRSASRVTGGLTAREHEILRLVADGCSNREIAQGLYLSVRTVERHLAGAYRKLGLHGRAARAAAVRFVVAAGRTPATARRPRTGQP